MKTFKLSLGPLKMRMREIPWYLLKESLGRAARLDFSDMGGLVYFLFKRDGYFRHLVKKFGAPAGFDFNGIKIPMIEDKRTFISEFFDLLYASVYDAADFPYDEGPYELDRVMLKAGDVVLDCGANVGIFSAYAASKGCKVYAFEPVPKAREYLKKTAALNPGITVVDCAVSDKTGSLDIYVDLNNLGESSLHPNVHEKNKYETVSVRAITLDEFVKDQGLTRVDFIKADIEGAERFMLAGATKVLRDFGPKLAICTYHLPDDPRILKEIILAANPAYTVVERWKKLYADV